jgi:hypothetical protein
MPIGTVKPRNALARNPDPSLRADVAPTSGLTKAAPPVPGLGGESPTTVSFTRGARPVPGASPVPGMRKAPSSSETTPNPPTALAFSYFAKEVSERTALAAVTGRSWKGSEYGAGGAGRAAAAVGSGGGGGGGGAEAESSSAAAFAETA